jgi:hypothetical protein
MNQYLPRTQAYAHSGYFLAENPVCLRDLMIKENVYPAGVKRSDGASAKTSKVKLTEYDTVLAMLALVWVFV